MNTLPHGSDRSGNDPFSIAYVRYEMSDALHAMVSNLYAPHIAETARSRYIEFRSLASRPVPLVSDDSPFAHSPEHTEQLERYSQGLDRVGEDEHIPLSANIALARAGRESWVLFDLLPSEHTKKALGSLAVYSVGDYQRYIAGVHLAPRERSELFNERIQDIAGKLGTNHPSRQGRAFLHPAPHVDKLYVAQPSLRIKPPAPTALS